MTGPADAPRPLVLLHGFTGAPESWDPVRRQLEPGRPVLAPAALGHDGTPGPPGIGGFEDEVDRLAREIEGFTATPVHLAGYSMGGRLALGLTVRHPGLVHRATLVGASPGPASESERSDRAKWDEGWAKLLETEGLDTFVAAWEALPLFADQDALDPAELEAQRRVRRGHDPRGLARSLRVAGLARMPDYRDALAEVDRPVRLVVGERDARFLRLAHDMAGRLPRATVTVVPDAGHNVVLEKPAAIAELLREDRTP